MSSSAIALPVHACAVYSFVVVSIVEPEARS